MSNMLIYGGFGFLLVAIIIALIAAIKGFLATKNIPITDLEGRNKVKIHLKKFTTPALVLGCIGVILIGAGIFFVII